MTRRPYSPKRPPATKAHKPAAALVLHHARRPKVVTMFSALVDGSGATDISGCTLIAVTAVDFYPRAKA